MRPSVLWKVLRDRKEKKQQETVRTEPEIDRDRITLNSHEAKWKEMTTSGEGWSMEPYKELKEFGTMEIKPQVSDSLMRFIWQALNRLKTQMKMK